MESCKASTNLKPHKLTFKLDVDNVLQPEPVQESICWRRWIFPIYSRPNVTVQLVGHQWAGTDLVLTSFSSNDLAPMLYDSLGVVSHSQTLIELCQRWRKSGCTHHSAIREQNSLACLYFFKPITIVLGPWCPRKIVLGRTCFSHGETSPGINWPSPCKRKANSC